ncbi:MAG: hypothetical protein OM95_04020 [Bdellovibrio sp. ArHS]|uniref:tetratricopeptide repeat protein n=1 Tax=Bdellovibrio sp. ArHS TaxID=1569284 RepID=UPI000583188A|nr:tetratricopeptide repeat protein [Bdellovibrio sp. ArHS]KHD89304.1 MAG: hypothetical protein OM95_04020 [Bdellovibrio sp. ArHS]
MKTSVESSYNFNIRKIPSILLGIFAFTVLILSQLFATSSLKNERALIAPPPQLQHFTFGYSESMADLFWIRAVQDFDYCDQKIAENVCRNNSWLFKMLDTITNLAPKFRTPYAAGALALTVIITDVDGATKIFEKGVKEFPHDWKISYRAAYHYLYEVKNPQRAAELLIQAGKNGAPPWVFTLAGRLYSDAGNTELAEALLQEMKDTQQDPALIKRLEDKILSIKASAK